MWVSLLQTKKARFIDHTVYIYPYRYMREVPPPGGVPLEMPLICDINWIIMIKYEP